MLMMTWQMCKPTHSSHSLRMTAMVAPAMAAMHLAVHTWYHRVLRSASQLHSSRLQRPKASNHSQVACSARVVGKICQVLRIRATVKKVYLL